jgi:hypothetical protein
LNGQTGGFELGRVVTDGELRNLLNKLGLLEDEIALGYGDNVKDLSDFRFELLGDLIILASEVKPATRVPNVEHEFLIVEERSDQVKILFTRQSDVDVGLLLCCKNVSVFLLHLV